MSLAVDRSFQLNIFERRLLFGDESTAGLHARLSRSRAQHGHDRGRLSRANRHSLLTERGRNEEKQLGAPSELGRDADLPQFGNRALYLSQLRLAHRKDSFALIDGRAIATMLAQPSKRCYARLMRTDCVASSVGTAPSPGISRTVVPTSFAHTLGAAGTAAEVGYESPSQFIREYARFFELPPRSDAKRIAQRDS